MSTVSLCMIVKDESAVIKRCLLSVLPWLDGWTVVDTGSSDHTPELVQAVLGNLPGQLVHRPWRNFAENRTEAFELNRSLADYHLVVDADDWLVAEADFRLSDLTADCYWLSVDLNGIRYGRPQLFRTAMEWRYEGVVHEFAHCAAACDSGKLAGLRYVCGYGEGARSRDPHKYLRDAELLEAALRRNPADTRSSFYLAQSYRDAGLLQEACAAYWQRTRLGGWREERYVSHLELARLLRRQDGPRAEIRSHLLDAVEINPARAEALVELAQVHRELGQWQLCHWFAREASQRSLPDDGLFLEEASYSWRPLDELALAEFYTGRFSVALERTAELLKDERLPDSQRPRLRQNLLHCLQQCEGRRSLVVA